MTKITIREFVNQYCTIVNNEDGTYRLTATNEKDCCINNLINEFHTNELHKIFVALEELIEETTWFKCTLELSNNQNPNSRIRLFQDGVYYATYNDDTPISEIFCDCIEGMFETLAESFPQTVNLIKDTYIHYRDNIE